MTEPASPAQQDREVLSVSDLNHRVKALLERQLGSIWIEGEISNFVAARSGHWYFTLKDPQAQVRCAMFRGRNSRLRFRPEDGLQVLIRARTGLYEARGEFQLLVDSMEEAGDGALRRAFEELKLRLQQEGLFDPALKKTLPDWPRTIGVVTSSTGAAIHDICTVLARRFPAIAVQVYPTSVQGKSAAREISAAIAKANREAHCDVLIVGRGGGSLEDLWSFNEEQVARAIFDSTIPVVSAVGHETDFTIADFVADYRAPTPSAAAELLSPNQADIRATLSSARSRLADAQRRALSTRKERLAMMAKRLRHPRQLLQERSQHLDHLDIRLGRAMRQLLEHRRRRIENRHAMLLMHGPQNQITRIGMQCTHLQDRMAQGMRHALHARRQTVIQMAASLDQISPLAVLGRGYALLSQEESGKLIRSASDAKTGDKLHARLGSGSLSCTVTQVSKP